MELLCHSCGAKDTERVSLRTGDTADANGDAEPVLWTIDLCPTCACGVFRTVLDMLSYTKHYDEDRNLQIAGIVMDIIRRGTL